MARPKEFDQEKALRKAVRLYSQKGFAATSTDELMRVMDLGRQSMYDLIAKMKKLGISRPVRKDGINPLSENRQSEQWWHPQLNEETSNGGYGKVSSRPSLH
jgi:hypothetical protein